MYFIQFCAHPCTPPFTRIRPISYCIQNFPQHRSTLLGFQRRSFRRNTILQQTIRWELASCLLRFLQGWFLTWTSPILCVVAHPLPEGSQSLVAVKSAIGPMSSSSPALLQFLAWLIARAHLETCVLVMLFKAFFHEMKVPRSSGGFVTPLFWAASSWFPCMHVIYHNSMSTPHDAL